MRTQAVLALLCMGLAFGCERSLPQHDAVSSAPPAPTTAPVPLSASATAKGEAIDAADNTPPSCVMIVNQEPITFPQAMLRFSKSGDHLTALLYSDDPKEALRSDYRGNGFYFQLALDVPDETFSRATWEHESETEQRVDTPYGIFLDGHRRQLQPLNVRIRILPALSGGYKVQMAGTFLSVDPRDELATARVVPVSAWVMAEKR